MPLRWVVLKPRMVWSARATVPVVHSCVGTELHHAEGHRGTREGMAVAARADERVDILGRVSNVIGLRLLVAGG